jgi:steroid 5-alpha reductase family enzyme
MKPIFIRAALGGFMVLGFCILTYINEAFMLGLLVVLGMMTGLWILSLYLKDSSIVDIFWGFGFTVMAWYYFGLATDYEFDNLRGQVLCSLVSLWGLRLTFHIGSRNIGKPEDYRYQEFRREAGATYWWFSFFKVFLLQGIILWILSSVFWVTVNSDIPTLGLFEYIGILFWAVGFFFETVGDWQLKKFKENPANKGKIMDSGLWKYTRHPNYFGDAMVWWGYFMFALGTEGGWLYFFVPIFMNFLLRFVSGVAMLEENLYKSKPGYKAYMRRTSAFLPMLPRE